MHFYNLNLHSELLQKCKALERTAEILHDYCQVANSHLDYSTKT